MSTTEETASGFNGNHPLVIVLAIVFIVGGWIKLKPAETTNE